MNLQGTLLEVLLASVCTFCTAFGSATTTMNCSTFGVLRRPYDIRCSVAGTIADGITWTRPDDITVTGCDLNNICVPIKGYDVPFANATLYILHIKGLQEIDAGEWTCRDCSEGTLGKGCSLTVHSSPNSDDHGLNNREIVGIAFGTFLGVFIIVTAVVFSYYYSCIKRK